MPVPCRHTQDACNVVAPCDVCTIISFACYDAGLIADGWLLYERVTYEFVL